MTPSVVSVGMSPTHNFPKPVVLSIELVAGLGVRGDAHAGATVRHRSRDARDLSQPNLRQVHRELFDELAGKGFSVGPGDIGENVVTAGVDLLALPVGTRVRLGATAVVELTGLRNPCAQLDDLQRGLMASVLDRAADGALVRKAGVMGMVLEDGTVRPGDAVRIDLPPPPHRALERV